MDKVFFDIETSGLNIGDEERADAEILRIEAIRVFGGEIKDRFFTYISPVNPLSVQAEKLTGIDAGKSEGAPDINAALTLFKEFAGDCPLIGYYAPFEMKFLNYYGSKCGITLDNPVYDFYPVMKKVLDKRVKNFSLNTVAKYFGIDSESEPEIVLALTRMKRYIENGLSKEYTEYVYPALKSINESMK